MAAGASGVNLQGNPANCLGYSPVCAPSAALLARGALRAQPEWYGLLMLRSLVGMRPLATRRDSSEPVDVAASVLRGPSGGLRIVLADDEASGSSPTVVHVRVGAGYAPATRADAQRRLSRLARGRDARGPRGRGRRQLARAALAAARARRRRRAQLRAGALSRRAAHARATAPALRALRELAARELDPVVALAAQRARSAGRRRAQRAGQRFAGAREEDRVQHRRAAVARCELEACRARRSGCASRPRAIRRAAGIVSGTSELPLSSPAIEPMPRPSTASATRGMIWPCTHTCQRPAEGSEKLTRSRPGRFMTSPPRRWPQPRGCASASERHRHGARAAIAAVTRTPDAAAVVSAAIARHCCAASPLSTRCTIAGAAPGARSHSS